MSRPALLVLALVLVGLFFILIGFVHPLWIVSCSAPADRGCAPASISSEVGYIGFVLIIGAAAVSISQYHYSHKGGQPS